MRVLGNVWILLYVNVDSLAGTGRYMYFIYILHLFKVFDKLEGGTVVLYLLKLVSEQSRGSSGPGTDGPCSH